MRGTVVSIAAIALVVAASAIPAFAASPTVSSFNPTSGPPGTFVTVVGSGFTASTVTAVTFNGFGATFNVSDDQHLSTTVPFGAASGKIAVTTSAGTGVSATDFVILVAPTISSFSPSSGPSGTPVTINGSHLTGVNGVKFSGVATTFNFISDAQVTTTVPVGASTGKITLTTPSGIATSSSNFSVNGSIAPTISGFSPSSGAIGTSVTINGNHLTGVNGVTFNGIPAGFAFVSDKKVTATVPSGAASGQIRLTTPVGTATSSGTFTVTSGTAPTISGFSPSSGVIGTSVTINGNHFTGINGVRFNGVSASYTFVNDNKVTATVPSGATTGKITVTTGAGTATSSGTFTLTSGTAPTISSFSPSTAGPGTSVTINGNHFTGVNGVRFNGVTAGYIFVNDDRLTATVPNGASTGHITVTTPAGTGTSSSNFVVLGGGMHDRSLSLKISRRYASGAVHVNDGYSACFANVPVVVKRLRHGSWRWVTTTSTRSDGGYRALIGTKRGRYRARAIKITLVNGAVCGGDRSPIAHR